MTWLWGGYAVGNPTLQRFFSLHYLLPFVIVGVVVLHIWALHVVGQNNPTGIDPKSGQDTVPFTPHATMKDGFMVALFCLFFAWFVFYMPNYLGHADNYIPANPGVTPAHIVPEWYYLPFYAILRAIPNKLAGVIAMFGSILVLAFLPWLDTSRVKSATYRPLYRQFFWVFVLVCLGLGWLGSQAGRRRLRDRGAHPHRLLLHPLPDHPAAARPDRDAEAAAELDLGSGAEEGEGRRGRAARARPRRADVARSGSSVIGARDDAPHPPRNKWSFAGGFGKFDQGQLQRGFKVYKEVCQTCHGLNLRVVPQPRRSGRPRLHGRRRRRPSRPNTRCRTGRTTRARCSSATGALADRFPPPSTWKNEAQARTLYNGTVPPDMSVLAKARSYERGFPLVPGRCAAVLRIPGARRRLRRGAAQGLQGQAAGRASSFRPAETTTNTSPAIRSRCRRR